MIDIDPVDGVIQAWAGTRLSDLNQALAPHGLCFPIDLGADPSVGGMLAATIIGIVIIPILFVVIEEVTKKLPK